MIAPPTLPQIEQDKKEIVESFERAFALIDQLAKDTEELKALENSRTTRFDTALTEVENALSNLKTSSRRGEDESRRITDEVRGLKELIPKAMEEQKEINESQLKELNNELRSLKKLLGQRMNSSVPSSSSLLGAGSTSGGLPLGQQSQTTAVDATSSDTEEKTPRHGLISSVNGLSPSQEQSSNLSSSNKAAIPAWQLAANRKSNSTKPTAILSQESSVST